MLDLIIKNGQCYIDGQLKEVNVAIKDGKIHKIGEISEEAKETIKAEGQTVLPGCIDTQTHFREPGSTDTEDLHSGSRAAIAVLLPECKSSVSVEPGSLKWVWVSIHPGKTVWPSAFIVSLASSEIWPIL